MLKRIMQRLGGLSRRARLAIGGGIILIAVAVAAVLTLDPFGGPYEHLNAKRPAYVHRDGLVLQLAKGIGDADVQVTTVPREVFLADQAGDNWRTAHAVLPAGITPLSPIYSIKVRRGMVTADMAIPNGADPLALLDVYRWDDAAHAWVFVPSRQNLDLQTITFMPEGRTISVMAVHTKPETVAAGVIISQGGPDLGSKYGLAMPEGVTIDKQGQVSGTPADSTASTVMPLVKHRNNGALNYADPNLQSSLAFQLEQLVLPYNGLVLDFDPGLGYADFVGILAKAIHAHGKRVEIVIRGTALDSNTLSGLARVADRIWFAPGDNPTLYVAHGPVETALAQLVTQVDRRALGLLVSGLDVDVSGDQAKNISLAQALAPFGSLQPVAGYGSSLLPGDNLALRLSGHVTAMGFDESVAMNYLTYTDTDAQTHYVYFGSAAGLERKLDWASQYGLGAVAVYGLAHPDAPSNLADGLTAFLSQQHLGQPQAYQLAWEVSGPDGSQVSQQSGDLSLLQYLWQAVMNPGQYVVRASLDNHSTPQPIGTLLVNVAENTPTATEPENTPTPTPSASRPSKPVPTQASASPPPPAPVAGSIVSGPFELGGQVPGSITHADLMHYAGMTWVKYQHKWSPGEDPSVVAGNIAEGKAQGFKVLISIPGNGLSSIDYSSYVNFVAGVAKEGADGIEIWNEMNFDTEWPANQLNGGIYTTQMLAPAFNAIKAANPATLVISGAPTPSGAFPAGCGLFALTGQTGCNDYEYIAQMRDAGATNYADCMGVHANAGATSPSATEGHPNDDGTHHYSWYYSKLFSLYSSTFGKALCFTELGYASAEGATVSPRFPWASSVSVAQQAQWLAETAVLASQSGQVRLMIVWNVDFTQSDPNDPQVDYAIVRPGGGCPACDALHNVH